jgi:hypothetical protein
MKILTVILALSCFGGVLALRYPQGKTAHGSEQNAGLSDAELQQVRERLPCLKPGMTMKEVYNLIGVDLPERAYASWGSGPGDDYRMVYQLAPASSEHGYNLVVVNDRELKFKRADIACWIQPNKCAEDNEKAKENPQECPNGLEE